MTGVSQSSLVKIHKPLVLRRHAYQDMTEIVEYERVVIYRDGQGHGPQNHGGRLGQEKRAGAAAGVSPRSPLEGRVAAGKQGGLEGKLPIAKPAKQGACGAPRAYSPTTVIDADGRHLAGPADQYGLAHSFKARYEGFLDSEAGDLLKAFLKDKGYEGSLDAQLYAVGEPDGTEHALAYRIIPQGPGPHLVGVNPRHLDTYAHNELEILSHEAIHAVVKDEEKTRALTDEYLGFLATYSQRRQEQRNPMYRDDHLEDCERLIAYRPLRSTGLANTALKYAA